MRERTKDALVAFTLLQGLVGEAGKGGGRKGLLSFNSSRNSSPQEKLVVRRSAGCVTYLFVLGNQVVLYCLEVLEVLGSLEDLGDLVSHESL